MQQNFRWGKAEAYIDLPGYTEAASHDDLPRNVQFTDAESKSLNAGRKAGLMNFGLTR